MSRRPGAGSAGRLFVVSGPSGAGKGTVVRGVLAQRPDVFLSISATTRPARQGERNGADYHFIPEAEFLGMRDRGEFLESAEVYGNYYGTPRGPVESALSVGKDVLCELDIQGAQAIKRAETHAILIFIEPPSLDDLKVRLRGRGTEDRDTLAQRLRAAYDEVKVKGIYDHIVVNDQVERAVEELLRIMNGSHTSKGTPR
ncbi:MAG TPA: guanylate kinase [Actinomycetota bacterium]|nr:guanylate kinase [Actinomycetota bacterium]